MLSEPEPTITMTSAELAALVDARIAERDAQAQAEVERIYRLNNPTPTPEPRKEASPELVAELERILKAAGWDVDEAWHATMRRCVLDVNRRPFDPQLAGWLDECWWFRAALHPEMKWNLVGNLIRNIARRHELAKAV